MSWSIFSKFNLNSAPESAAAKKGFSKCKRALSYLMKLYNLHCM